MSPAPIIANEYYFEQWGAVGVGNDDTALMQQAINDVPVHSVFRLNNAIYNFTNLIATKCVTIQGNGYSTSSDNHFGNETYLQDVRFWGSVLRCHATDGVGLQLFEPKGRPIGLQNLLIVGPGSGTSMGINLTGGTPGWFAVQNMWKNVAVMNFSQGINFPFVVNNSIYEMVIKGCQTGLIMSGDSTTLKLYNPTIDFVSTAMLFKENVSGADIFSPVICNLTETTGKGIVIGIGTDNPRNIKIYGGWFEPGGSVLRPAIEINGGRNSGIIGGNFSGTAQVNIIKGANPFVKHSYFTGTGEVIRIQAHQVDDEIINDNDIPSGSVRHW